MGCQCPILDMWNVNFNHGKGVQGHGFFVTRDLVDPVMRQRRVERPGIIGCNILQRVGRLP